jgi:hypothetical protein
MSGRIAAINLAREGCAVTVHDREPGYGGSKLYNPSTHVTPLHPEQFLKPLLISTVGIPCKWWFTNRKETRCTTFGSPGRRQHKDTRLETCSSTLEGGAATGYLQSPLV